MTFLNLTFLWALPLLAVPIAIHLLSRRRQEVVKWGAMQFLMTGSIRRRRIWRIDDLLLMLLRILAVIGLILALARPLWHGSGPTGGARREVIFVWDVSLSMGKKWGEKKAYDWMLEKTEGLMHQLGKSDRIRGLVTAGPGEWLTADPLSGTSEEQQLLLNRLREFGLTETDADWRRIIEMALRTPATPGVTARLVVVITDGQSEGWNHEDETAWKDLLNAEPPDSIATAVELYQISDESQSQENLSVAGLTTPRQLLGSGETFLVEARVQNHGLQQSNSATVEWTLDDQSLGQTSVPALSAGQSARMTVKASTESAGIRQITCTLRYDDVLPADNSRSLLVETIDHVPLLMVDDETETDPLRSDRGYLLAALGQSPEQNPLKVSSEPDDVQRTTSPAMGLFHVQVVPSRSLESETLENYRAILMPNVPVLSEPAVAKVSSFVRKGGALWLSLGDRTNSEEFNRMFYRGGSGLSPWAVLPAKGDLIERERFDTIHPPDKEHPATALLSDTRRLDIDRAKIFRHFSFRSAQSGSRVPVLLKSGTGEALAIEGLSGRGRVIVQALPMGVRWSNLPLTQAWVPLVHEWLWYLLQPTAESLNLHSGETLVVNLPENTGTSRVTVRSPSGIDIPLTVVPQGSRSTARTHRTFLPGFYEASVLTEGRPETHRRYQVLRPEEESQLAPWTSAAVSTFSSMKNVRMNPASPMEMPVTSSGIRSGQPISAWLLLVVILAILAELYLARRIAMKRFGFLNFGSMPNDAADHRTSAQPGMAPVYSGRLPNEL